MIYTTRKTYGKRFAGAVLPLCLAMLLLLTAAIGVHKHRKKDPTFAIQNPYENVNDVQNFILPKNTFITNASVSEFSPLDLFNTTKNESVSTPAPSIIKPPVMRKTNFNSDWRLATVKPGDSLSKVFARLNIPYKEVLSILKLPTAKPYFKHIKPHQSIYFKLDEKNNLLALKYPTDETTLFITKIKNSYHAKVEKKPIETITAYKSGVIHRSLADATKHAGLSRSLHKQFLNIFKSKINFAKQTHPGDHFSLLYNEYYVDGKKNNRSEIVAAEYTSRNKTYRVVRFCYPHHKATYYTPDGHEFGASPRSLFLSAPMKYKRITSRFTYHRMDPVLHRVHPHLGVDYAAAPGTPIKSIGNGKVVFFGNRNGYGKTVMVQYGSKYQALYAHLKKFSKYLKRNSYVEMGQVIGYLGSTGWTTGPHLHFELHVNGTPKDPLKIHLPTALPGVPNKYLPRFFATTHALLARLKMYDEPIFAENKTLKNTHED